MRACPIYLAAGPPLPIEPRSNHPCHSTIYFAGYSFQPEPSVWSRAGSTLQRWLWGALCCGVPGIPCYFCNSCCEKVDDDVAMERDPPRVHQATATAERLARPRRPHAPGNRKSTPEMLSAVRCALSQLQGEPAPPPPLLTDSPKERQAEAEPG